MPLQVMVIGWIPVGDERIFMFWVSSIEIFAAGFTSDGKETVVYILDGPIEIVIPVWISGGDEWIVVFWISSIQVFSAGSALNGIFDAGKKLHGHKGPL